jgi:hypothetical protein
MLTSSRFFNPSEFLVTSTGLPNSLPADLEDNLAQLMLTMDMVREALGKPVRITSAYRSPEVNAAIRGAKNSAHLRGLAADFVCAGQDPISICQQILDARPYIEFDQLIAEFRGSQRWVHIGLDAGMRRQVLTYRDGKYLSGLQP